MGQDRGGRGKKADSGPCDAAQQRLSDSILKKRRGCASSAGNLGAVTTVDCVTAVSSYNVTKRYKKPQSMAGTRCARALLVAALATVALLRGSHAAADMLRIGVDAEQRITLSGSSDSLRATLIEICRQAGVELRAYEAEDRGFSAEYQAVPLTEAVTRLLRSEVFIAGTRLAPDGSGSRLSWLRVSGSRGGVTTTLSVASTAPPGEQPAHPASDLGLGSNPRLVETALTSRDATARGRAREVILGELEDDPASLQRFVDRDLEYLVGELAAFPHAAEFLRALQTATTDRDERMALQTLIGKVQIAQAQN